MIAFSRGLRPCLAQLLPAASLVVLSACDGSLSVDGEVPETRCEMGLWFTAKPIWGGSGPRLRKTAVVGGAFDVNWTVSGTSAPHWLEITCPSGGKFKSHEFEAGKLGVTVSLGKVTLTPSSSSSSPPAKPP